VLHELNKASELTDQFSFSSQSLQNESSSIQFSSLRSLRTSLNNWQNIFLNSSHIPIVVLIQPKQTRSFHSFAPYSSIWTPQSMTSSLRKIIFTVLF